MKNKFLLIIVLLSVLIVGGCGDSNKKRGTLSAPQEVSVRLEGDKSFIVFDEVDNAEFYYIYINDMAISVKGDGSGTVEYDASKIFTQPKQYIIKIKAVNENYFDSEFSIEYSYNHTKTLQTPTISIDGHVINWDKIPNADFYDILVISNNPYMETTHRFTDNKFNFSNILVNKGEYIFKVKALSESDDYIASSYSNEIKYINTQQLITPNNLEISYDNINNEILLTFISSENIKNFVLNVNNVNYNLDETIFNTYTIGNDFDNLYTIKLSSFLKAKGVDIENLQLINISVRAISNDKYDVNSQYSQNISYQIVNKLSTPKISINKSINSCRIDIDMPNSQYLNGFDIYLGDQKFRTVATNVTSIDIPINEIGNKGIRIQALSNNNNCYNSCLSNVVYLDDSLLNLDDLQITYNDNNISWLDIADNYYIEISNNSYIYSSFSDINNIDIAFLPNGQYKVKVVGFKDGYRQAENEIDIVKEAKLSNIQNIQINNSGEGIILSFDKVDKAYGYLIYLQDVMVNHVFTSNIIDISAYITNAASYNIKVQAFAPINSYLTNSDISNSTLLENLKTLSHPQLTITKEGDSYYLNVDVDERESSLASGYNLWINYVSIGVRNFEDAKIDISSYLSTAGQYNFMIQALALESNSYVKDSNIYSITYKCTMQLGEVTGISVEENIEEGRYILTFNEQTLVAKYEVTILKANDDSYNVTFELNNGFADISQYVIDEGTYKVYVKAIAIEDSFYTDSATSGNPYIFKKGLTLDTVNNILVTKDNDGKIWLKWDNVENSLSYKVNIYYVNNNEQLLRKSIQTQSSQLNIGEGENKCLDKEGYYIFKIKAIGNEEEYESSQYSTYSYRYIMESVSDFNRNTIFMYGDNYSYNVSTFDQLQHLLWYHYLYNDQIWDYSETLDYNLKIYCEINLDEMALEYSEDLYNKIYLLSSQQEKMNEIAREAMRQYPETAAWTYGTTSQQFCLKPDDRNIFIFRYEDVLNKDKLDVVSSEDTSFPNKIDEIASFEQRPSNYVFNIDKLESIDVTTTEQLYMAVQYGKKPNFVGDSDVAEIVYANARQILRELCSDTMTDYEKVLKIYEFLTTSVAYNNDVVLGGASQEVVLEDGSTSRLGNIRDFYLEGVFYDLDNKRAVCDGLSKAFVLMCSIEGIEAIKVKGTLQNGAYHSWNKVYLEIDGESDWYVIDTTNPRSNIVINNIEYDVGNHTFFLLSDSQYNRSVNAVETYSHKGFVIANTNYDYYAQTTYYIKEENMDLEVTGSLKFNSATSLESQIQELMAYGMIKTNTSRSTNRNSIIVEMNISQVTGDQDTLLNSIPVHYNTVRTRLTNTVQNYNYDCSIVRAMITRESLVIVFMPTAPQ